MVWETFGVAVFRRPRKCGERKKEKKRKKLSVKYTECGIKTTPLRKLKFLENDKAYFAVFFIS